MGRERYLNKDVLRLPPYDVAIPLQLLVAFVNLQRVVLRVVVLTSRCQDDIDI